MSSPYSSIAVTLDRYGHLLPSIEQRIAAELDEAYRAVPSSRGEQGARVRDLARP